MNTSKMNIQVTPPPGGAGPTPTSGGKRSTPKKPSTPQQTSMLSALSQPLSPAGSGCTGNPRNKVALKPGHSLMDWIRLGKSGQDLTGVGGVQRRVSMEELAKHNTKQDAWIAIHGKVFNVTAYMDFHPGGEDELMRGVGIDATKLFEEVHNWVNYVSMLSKCYVGPLVIESPAKKSPKKSASTLSVTPPVDGFPTPSLAPPKALPSNNKPRYEWFQSETTVTLVLYTKSIKTRHEDVIMDKCDKELTLTLCLPDQIYTVCYNLEGEISDDYEVKIADNRVKLEVKLQKTVPGVQWNSLGKATDNNDKLKKKEDKVDRSYELVSIEKVTHDTNLYCFCVPASSRVCVPLGYHMYFKATVSDMDLVRSYTVVPPSLSPDTQDENVEKGRVFYCMIKIYPDGAFTPILNEMSLGDHIDAHGPDGNFVEDRLTDLTHLVMYAAGTGFTPMAGLILRNTAMQKHSNRDGLYTSESDVCRIKTDPALKGQIMLVFFNKTEEDILWKDQLDELERTCDNVRHVLSQPGSDWQGLTGRVREELMDGIIPVPQPDTHILLCACGPSPFTSEVIRLARQCNYTDEMLHAFLA